MCLISVWLIKEEVIKHFYGTPTMTNVSGKHLCKWVASWTSPLFLQNTIFIWKNIIKKTMVVQTWVFGRLFLINKVSLLLQVKQPRVFAANDKIWTFGSKVEIWKTCICHGETDYFPTFKEFSKIGTDVFQVGFCDII